MAGSLERAQQKIKLISKHLVGCDKCRYKYASDWTTISTKLCMLNTTTKCCREIANNILGKKPGEISGRDPQTDSNRKIAIKWKPC